MRLTFSKPALERVAVTNPRTTPKLCAVFSAGFNLTLAKSLGLADVLFDKAGVIRTFPYHGVKVQLAEATIEFTRPATPSGKEGEGRSFAGEAEVVKVIQEPIKDGVVTTCEFKLFFAGNEKVKAFSHLVDGEPAEWRSIGIKGKQAELEFDSEAEPGPGATEEE